NNFWAFSRCFGYGNLHRVFNITAKQFREKYYFNKAPRVNPCLIVGVHVRRGDVSKRNNPEMWTELTHISTTISRIIHVLDKRTLKYRIRLLSDGNYFEFRELESLGVELHLNADPLWTMRELIEADILVMAKSTFSYIAAIISDG